MFESKQPIKEPGFSAACYTVTPGSVCASDASSINPIGAALGVISVLPALPVELQVDTDGDGVSDNADSDPLFAN
jgi:hypothetical protein